MSKIPGKEQRLKREIKEKTVGYILAAFGFVAGLAWNEAIKSLIDVFFPASKNSVFMKFGYALVVTLLVVVVTMYLVRTSESKQKKL